MNGVVIGVVAVVVLGVVLALIVIGMYNRLVRIRQHMRDSWSGVDVELKRRYDLIPNLVQTVKGYASHESETLEKVIQARNVAAANHGSPESQARDESMLVGALKQLAVVVEQYPDLKANTNFLALQSELTETEDRIASSRRLYNGNVREMNTAVEVFPSSIVAGMFGFARAEYFEIEDAAMRAAPEVSF